MLERSQFAAETAGLRGASVAVDPRQLECFIAVAEELNLNRAAARLHMTQHVGFGREYDDEPGILCRSVISEDLYVAVKDSAVTEPLQAMSISELRGQPLVIYPPTRPGFGDEVIHICLEAGFSPVIAVEAEDVVACLAYVAIGAAIGIVPESAAKTHVHGVTFVPLLDAPPSRLNCVYLKANRAPTLALFKAFLDARS